MGYCLYNALLNIFPNLKRNVINQFIKIKQEEKFIKNRLLKNKLIYNKISKIIISFYLLQLGILFLLKNTIIDFMYFDIMTHNIYIGLLREYIVAGERRFLMQTSKRSFRKIRKNYSAVSEVLGTVLILVISVIILSAVYVAVFSIPSSNNSPVLNVVGMTANDEDIIISHQGGDDLSLNSILILTIGGQEIKYVIEDLLDAESIEDGFWNIGEEIIINYDIRDLQVEVKIIDAETNSVVMMGLLQEGYYIRDPYVFTINATDITANSAKLVMEYNFWDKSGSIRFSYRVSSGSWVNTAWIAKSGEGNYELNINGLIYDTLYEYKAELIWDINTTEGGVNTFTTASPSVLTLDATDIQTRSAKLWMQYDFKGLSGSVCFSYRPDGGSWIDTSWIAASGQGTYSEIIEDLTPKVLYEFKARITYDIITDDGNTKSFITWSIIMGMWHFAEGSGTTAYDTSGLDNHGTIFGADWVAGVNTTALSFDGIDDYLRVYDSNSLDITEYLTLEAWIKPLEKSEGYIGDITDSLIDTSWFGPNYGRDSDIIQISATIYAISFRGDGDDGYIATFTITTNGIIKNIIDYFEFDTVNCYNPDIIHITNNVYAIAYEGPDFDGLLKTVLINSDGQINDAVIDTLEFDTVNGLDPNILHINGNIYVIAYSGLNDDGFVKSIEILDTGMITDSFIDNTIFFDVESGVSIHEPILIHVGNNNYAIVVRNPDDDGEVRTITILDDGTFTSPSYSDGEYTDKFLFDGYDGWAPDVIHINGNIYAVSYRGRDGRGALVTIDVDINGIIQNDIVDKFYFEANTCYDPKILHLTGNYYLIAYRGVEDDGFLIVTEIAADGQITDSVIKNYEFDTINCFKPIMQHYNGDTFIIAYTNNNEGYIKTVNVTSALEISEVYVSLYTIFDFFNPYITRVYNDVYAIVSQGLDADGYLRTIQISNAGDISNTFIDVLEYDLVNGRDNKIINIFGNIFAIIYRGPDDDGYIKTVEILNDGDIKDDTIIDIMEFDSSYCFEPDIYHIAGDIYAIVYRGYGDDGYLKTVEILNSGELPASGLAKDTLEFETSYCCEPEIIHIADNVYAIVYRGPDNDGYIKTVVIMDNGDIVDTVVDTYEYDTSSGYEPEIINVYNSLGNDNIFAIIHSYQSGGGYLSTIEIADDGTITKSILDYERFENRQPTGDDDCYDPQIIHIDDWVYAVIYRGEKDGYVKTLRIGNNGDISDVNDDYLLFDAEGFEPQIINVDGNIYAIPYRGVNSNVAIKTIEIIPINATWPRPVVYKQSAYGLQSNGISVFGYINSNTITAPLSSDFNYVVLTFNSSLSSYQMKLYINSILQDEINVSGTINVNSYNIIMGNDYNCVLDDVTLWNIALSDAQILTNYNLLKP
ncbi:MAG: type IV pilin [Thermoplasmatales archaeon]|nr:MAG: type IV pilin [Thermoplasmatales archaeon]